MAAYFLRWSGHKSPLQKAVPCFVPRSFDSVPDPLAWYPVLGYFLSAKAVGSASTVPLAVFYGRGSRSIRDIQGIAPVGYKFIKCKAKV